MLISKNDNALESINSALHIGLADTRARFGNLQLYSHFQQIFSIAHKRTVGFEGLVRGVNDENRLCSPVEIFAAAKDEAQIVLLDRLCRAVHFHNFSRHNIDSCWLFLNINPRVVVDGKHYGPYFREMLNEVNISPRRVVVEILETAIVDKGLLKESVNYYRELGCLIAIDDFGAGDSNFDRIWQLRPDIVKFDRSVIAQACANPDIRSVVPGMVSMVHEAGSMVVMEGIETEQQAMIAMEADAEFVQGYYFARPSPTPTMSASFNSGCQELFIKFNRYRTIDRASYHSEITPYTTGLSKAAALMKTGQTMEQACLSFLALPDAERCFLLDAGGMQIGRNVDKTQLHLDADERYLPLNDATGANWSRRHYFQRAIAQLDKVNVTRPYLSITTASQCVTASIAFKVNGNLQILCGDISWNNDVRSADRTIETSS